MAKEKKTTGKAANKKTVSKKTSENKKAPSKPTAKKMDIKQTSGKKTKTAETKKMHNEKIKTSSKSLSYKYRQTEEEKKLAKELRTLLANLDSEGLLFLIEQAKIHIYNMQVIALQQGLSDIEEKRKKVKLSEKSKPEKNTFRIEKSSDGSVFHIVCNGKWKLINSDEMFSILKIVNSGLDNEEIRLNLIHWFFNERADFVSDFGLADTHDLRWIEFIKILKSDFKLKI